MGLTPVFLVTCALLSLSGVQKLRAPGRAADSLRLVGVPAPVLAVGVLATAEVAVGAAAAVRPTAVTAGLVALAYATFLGFLVLVRRRAGAPADCGCFGDAPAPAGRAHLALDAAACLVAVFAVLSPPPGLAWVLARPPVVALTLAVGIGAAVLAGYLAFTAFPAAWRAYQR